MAMHHRSRHPNSSGGGGNPFTGRRLPANSPYRQQHNDNQSSQPNLNGMAKKALLIISSFCIFFYIVSGGSGVDEQQQYTTAASSGESQYTKDLNDMKRKKQRKIQQELGNSDIQKTPTKLVLPPNDEISKSRDTDSQNINYDTFNNNHDSMNLDESHLGYETETDNNEKYQYSNQFNEFNVDASKSRSGNVVDELDRSNNSNSNDLYRDQSNLSADGEAPPSKEEDSNNSRSSNRLYTIGDESYRREDKSNTFGDTDDRGGGLRGKTKSRSNNKKRESDNQFGRVVTHDDDARRSPDNQMDTTGDRYTSDQTKLLNKRGYDDTDEKKGSSNSDEGEEDNNSNIVFPKSSDVVDGAFYKHQDQMAIPRLIEPDNNNSDETSRESTYMKKRRDFQTNVSGDVKKYLQSMNEQSETRKVVVSSDDNSGETNKEVDEETSYKKQSDDLTDKERYSSVKRRSNTYKHKSVGDEDLYNKQKHSAKEVDGVSSDDVADKDDLYSSTKKRMSDTYSKKEKFDEVDSFERQTKKRSHSVEDKYAKSPSASNEDKLTEYRRDNHMQDDSKEKEETTLSEKKSIVGDNYPGSEEDLKRYASFDKHLLNGIDEVTDNTSLGKRKHSTQKQFDDLTAISNKASSLIESDYPEEKHMTKDSASHSGESLLNSNTVKGLDEMNNSSYKKKQTKDVEGTELFYESRTQKEMGKSSDDVKASGSGDISQNDKHAQGLEGLNTVKKPRVFNDMTKSNSEDTVNTRYQKPMDTKDLDDSHVSKRSGSAASRSDDRPDESEYVSSKKSIPSASHVMDKPEEEEYTTKDYSEKKAQSGDELLSNVDESAYNKEYQRKSHSTDEKKSLFDQADGEQREPIDGSDNSGDTRRVKKYDKIGDSRSKKYEKREEKDEDGEKNTNLINRDTAPKLEALSFSKKNISLDDKYNDSDKASRINDRYYGDKKEKYSTYKQTEGIVTADEDSKSKDNENVAMEIGDLAKNRYPATKRRSPSTYQQNEDRKVDDVSGSSDTKKVMDVEDSNKDDELRSNTTREEKTLAKESEDEARPSGEESKPSVDSKDLIKNEDASKDLSKASKSADDNEKEIETEEKTVLLSRLRKKKTYDTKDVSVDVKKEKVSESNSIESEVKSPLSKLRLKKKTASYAQDVSNESEDDAGGGKNDIDSSVLGEKNSKSENSNEDASGRTELLGNLQIKKKLSDEDNSGVTEGETERGDGSSHDKSNIVLTAEEESTSIKKKKKRYRDI